MPEAKRGSASRLPSSDDWLPPAMLRTGEELFFNPSKGQVEARLRTYWEDLLLEETPVAISDWATAADLLAQAARQQLDRWLPAGGHGGGEFFVPRALAIGLRGQIWNCRPSMSKNCNSCCLLFATDCGRLPNCKRPIGCRIFALKLVTNGWLKLIDLRRRNSNYRTAIVTRSRTKLESRPCLR